MSQQGLVEVQAGARIHDCLCGEHSAVHHSAIPAWLTVVDFISKSNSICFLISFGTVRSKTVARTPPGTRRTQPCCRRKVARAPGAPRTITWSLLGPARNLSLATRLGWNQKVGVMSREGMREGMREEQANPKLEGVLLVQYLSVFKGLKTEVFEIKS